MRVILLIVVLLLIGAGVGWLSFSSPDGDPTLRVNSEKVKQDTAVIVEKSKQALDNLNNKVNEPESVSQ